MLTCPVCHIYKTVIAAKLSNHMRIHSDERQFKCSVCGRGFKQIAQLKNHSVIHLGKNSDVIPSWYAKKQCDICCKVFSDSKCLKKHVQAVHSKLRPYICHVCNHQSSRKAMLESHMRQHTGSKPYACDECDYRTGDHNSLRRHRMRHSGAKPYKCRWCDYAAIQSATLKNHVMSKHPENSSSSVAELAREQQISAEDDTSQEINVVTAQAGDDGLQGQIITIEIPKTPDIAGE